jgi:FeoB-associated Cys-rich membrane protein
MPLQTIVALLIVAGAAFLLVRRIRNSLKKGSPPSCNCGCSGCEASNACEALHDTRSHKQISH